MRIVFLILILSLYIKVHSQETYIFTDSLSIFGAELVDHGSKVNSKFCSVKNMNVEKQFTPNEINEYGLWDGRKYFSKYIYIGDTVRKVFVERLVEGKFNLYYYVGEKTQKFYLEKDSTSFIELPKYSNKTKETYRSRLLEILTKCDKVGETIKIIPYSKSSLAYLIENYNNCKKRPYTYLKYGINTGFGINKIIPFSQNVNSPIYKFDYNLESNFMFGAFIDIPVTVNNLSLHTEINYSKLNYSYTSRIDNSLDYDFVADISNLTLPVMFRYSFLKEKYRPFANLGLLYNYQLKNSVYLYETTFYQYIFDVKRTDVSYYFPQHSFGITFGGGIEYKMNYKNSFFLELRFNQHFGYPVVEGFDRKELMLMGSVNI